MVLTSLIPAFLINSLNHSVYLIMDDHFFSCWLFRLFNLSNSEYAFPDESISSQFFKNWVLNPVQLSGCLSVLVASSKLVFSFSFHCRASSLMCCNASNIFNSFPLCVHAKVKLNIGDELFGILSFAFKGRTCS